MENDMNKQEANKLMYEFEKLRKEVDQWNKDAEKFGVKFKEDFDTVLKTIANQAGISR